MDIMTSHPSSALRKSFLAHLGAQGLWFLQFGIQIVIAPSLSVLFLHATPLQAGLVQTAFFLPNIFLLLVGGLATKRQGAHRVLCTVHSFACLPHLWLAFLLITGTLNLWWMALHATIIGTFSSFTLPARETLLYDLSSENVQRGVLLSSSVQHVGKIIGMIAASLVVFIGIPTLLITEAVLVFFGLPLLLLIPAKHRTRSVARKDNSPMQDISLAVKTVMTNPMIKNLLYTMLLLSSFIGIYAVLMPLLIRDVYAGDVWNIGVNQISFWTGAACAVLLLSVFKTFHRKGLIIFFCALGSQMVFFLIILYPPLFLLVACTFVWGMLGGVCIAMARTIIQEACTNENRSLILSCYQMSFFLGFPVGSFACGMIIDTLNIRMGVILLTLMSLFFLLVCLPRFIAMKTPPPSPKPPSSHKTSSSLSTVSAEKSS